MFRILCCVYWYRLWKLGFFSTHSYFRNTVHHFYLRHNPKRNRTIHHSSMDHFTPCTVVQRRKCWANRSPVCLFAHTVHSSVRLLGHSVTFELVGKWMTRCLKTTWTYPTVSCSVTSLSVTLPYIIVLCIISRHEASQLLGPRHVAPQLFGPTPCSAIVIWSHAM